MEKRSAKANVRIVAVPVTIAMTLAIALTKIHFDPSSAKSFGLYLWIAMSVGFIYLFVWNITAIVTGNEDTFSHWEYEGEGKNPTRIVLGKKGTILATLWSLTIFLLGLTG